MFLLISSNTISTTTKTGMKFLPLVLVSEGGCLGSTAINHFIEKMINAHGLQRYDKVRFDYINGKKFQKKNPIFHELFNRTEYNYLTRTEMLFDSVEKAKNDAAREGKLFYFKAQEKYGQHKKLRERMDQIGVAFAGIYRHNVLDRCICATKDCFADAAGYPVFASNRTRTDLCFARRKLRVPTLAHLENPEPCFQRSLNLQNSIRSHDFPAVSEETLFEFEYTDSDEAFHRSAMAWVKLLRPLLSAALDYSKVRKVLEQHRYSRPPPKPHRDMVSNYDYLVKEIEGTKWEKYLRRGM